MVAIIQAFKNQMTTPTWFGWYHLMWLAITVIACVLVYVFRNKINGRTLNILLLVAGTCLILLELIKQVERSASIGDGNVINWHYPPSDFPFQFCSTPMYLMLLAGILKRGKIYDACTCYLATYAFFAGALVLIYPLGVFVQSIFINVHTMIWHSSMFVIGFMILATHSVEFKIKSVLKATIVFGIILVMAILMNVFAHLIAPDEYFNMFYIGPYYPNNFVVLQDIYQHVPWAVFIVIYAFGFFLSCLIIMLLVMLADKLSQKLHKEKV